MLYDYENRYYDYENGTIDDDHIRRTFRCDFISVIDYYDIPDYGLRGRYKYSPIIAVLAPIPGMLLPIAGLLQRHGYKHRSVPFVLCAITFLAVLVLCVILFFPF